MVLAQDARRFRGALTRYAMVAAMMTSQAALPTNQSCGDHLSIRRCEHCMRIGGRTMVTECALASSLSKLRMIADCIPVAMPATP